MGHISLVTEHSTTVRLYCFVLFCFSSWNYIGSLGIDILFETNPPVSQNQCRISIPKDLPGLICDNTQRSHKGENVLTFQIVKGECFILQDAPGDWFSQISGAVKFHWGQGWKGKHSIIQNIQNFPLIDGLASKNNSETLVSFQDWEPK